MKPIHSVFRGSVSQFRERLGVKFAYFRDECPYDDVLLEIEKLDDPIEIAVMGLLRLCDGSGRTIDRVILLAVVDYLDTVMSPEITDRLARLRALARILPTADEHAYRDWALRYYS